VDNDVLAQYLAGFAIGRTGVAWELSGAAGFLERQHDRILLPQRILFPNRGWTDRIALLRIKPGLVDRFGGNPAKEILGRLLLLGIAHQHVGHWQMIRELPRGTLGQFAMQDVLPNRTALLALVFVGLTLGQQIDRGAIERR